MEDFIKEQELQKQEALEVINKANALSLTVNTQGWEIILDTLESMKQDQLDHLSEQVPGDEKGILAAHAVWYSVCHAFDNLIDAVNTAIRQGEAAHQFLAELKQTPEEWS